MKNISIIIQARMAASRLPGKVLLDISGKPMLAWVVSRARCSKLAADVVVATTLEPSDDPVFNFCGQNEFPVLRGSAQDVLDRYYQTAKSYKADIIIRITADCPFIDPEIIDQAVGLMVPGNSTKDLDQERSKPRYDFVANRLPAPWERTFPIGLDIEVFTFEILEEAWKRAKSKHQREHVTPYFYDDALVEPLNVQVPFSPTSSAITPKGFHIALMHHFPDYGQLRWTVDTPEDLEAVRAIASYFPDDTFCWKDVLELAARKPELTKINALIKHKTHFDVDDRT